MQLAPPKERNTNKATLFGANLLFFFRPNAITHISIPRRIRIKRGGMVVCVMHGLNKFSGVGFSFDSGYTTGSSTTGEKGGGRYNDVKNPPVVVELPNASNKMLHAPCARR